MNKRQFLTSFGMGLLGAVVRPRLALGAEAPRRRPKNWVWISKPLDAREDEWHRTFEGLHARGIEAVAVEMYDGSHAYWASARVPVKKDVLDTVLSASRRHAVEVHAWVRANPEPRPERLAAIVAELADVPTLIGIHLDLSGVGERSTADCDAACWTRRTQLIKETLVPAARTRGTLISAAVPLEAGARWSAWPLDAFVPVASEVEGALDVMRRQTAEVVASVSAPVYCGLVAGSLAPESLARAARAALAGGATGVSLFDFASMDDARWTAFTQAVALG